MGIEQKSLGSKAKTIEASLTIGADDEPIAIGKDGISRSISDRLSSIRGRMTGHHPSGCGTYPGGWGDAGGSCSSSGWGDSQ